MLAGAADAAPTPAPARHLWFANVTLGVPFATPRTRRASSVLEWFSCFPAVQLCHGFRRGVRRGKNLVASLLAGANRRCTSGSPFWFRQDGSLQRRRRHRADTCASCLAPSIGTLPPHRWPDSSICIRSIPCRTPLHRLRGMLSLIPTAANCRDRQRQRCPKESRSRDAPHIGQDISITARGSACRRSGCRHACQ